MAKVKITLLHDSDHPDAKGMPGDVIECDESIAQTFIDGRGAELVKEAPPAEKPAPRKRKGAPTTKPASAE
jgi:hypothetical protein